MVGPSLRVLQERLFALLTAPAGVRSGLAALGLDERAVDDVIEGDARRSAIGRLDIYANMYFFRIRDALRADFPKLAALLGADVFHNLCTDYLWACPSEHPSLRWAGARLPAYLAAHALGREQPAAIDLARLEWARADLFDAPDAAPLTVDDVRALGAESLAALPLRWVPAHARLDVAWPADELWRAVERGDVPSLPAAPSSRTLIVWRQGVVVYHRAVEPAEHDALAVLDEGASFAALCERLAARAPVEAAAAQAFALLARWLTDEWIVAP
jgi:hypothetical protein